MPYSPAKKLYEVGTAEVCCLEGTDYPPGSPREYTDIWLTEWFDLDDVPLWEPVRPGLPFLSMEPTRRRYNWRPKSRTSEESAEVIELAALVMQLTHTGLTIIDIIVTPRM